MQTQTKICQNCKQPFEIELEDFAFYERIKVPPPTFCWTCRLQRRLGSRRNARLMYHDECDKCNQKIISMYAPQSPFKVYCLECFHSDAWDSREYGRDYDFSKTFFEQYYELMKAVPRAQSRTRNSPGTRFSDGSIDCKNCFMCIGGYKSEDCMYSGPIFSKNVVDSNIVLNGDHVYETYSAFNIFNSKFSYFTDDTLDSSFMFDCKGCTSCFGCINLRNQQYQIFNKKYSKAEYREQMKYWDLGSYAKLREALGRFDELRLSIPHRYAITSNVVDVLGNDIHNTKNCQYCFVTENGVENCKFIYLGGLSLKDSYDLASGGDNSQILYECVGIISSERLFFCNGANSSHDVEYSEQAIGSSNLFGCVSLKHRQYCILNKQYTPEEYAKLVVKIKEHMQTMPYVDKKGRTYGYGEYFPIEFSPNAYNESWAFEEFPMTKEEALAEGYYWHDKEQEKYRVDIATEKLPDHIRDVPDDLANKIIACAHGGTCNELCTTAFRIIPEELAFYKHVNVALPRFCPNCRFFARKQKQNPLKLWHRSCMRQGCPNEFETTYAPDRPEIIYCQECYNAEFL